VIFPFETEVYAGTGLKVDFVGHPLVDRLGEFALEYSRQDCRQRLRLNTEVPLVALLPWCRRNDVQGTLPLQLEVARELHARDPRIHFAVGVAPSIDRTRVDAAIAAAGLPALLDLRVFEDRSYELVRAADAVLAKPGTITVEVALLGTPMVVAARVNPLSAFIMRRLVHVPSFTMPNLIAASSVVPEFLQEEAEPEAIADALADLLAGRGAALQCQKLAGVCRQLGRGGAARRGAEIVQEMLRGTAGS